MVANSKDPQGLSMEGSDSSLIVVSVELGNGAVVGKELSEEIEGWKES